MNYSNLIRNISTVVALACSGAVSAAFGQTPCENLKSLTLPNVTFTTVESVAAGPFRPAPPPSRGPAPAAAGRGGAPAQGGRGAAPPLMLPAYCRAAIVLTPSARSEERRVG